MKNSFLVSLPFLLFFISVQAQKLNRTEKKIIKKVELLNIESINFLEKVVNINSGTLNKKGVREVGNIFNEEFKSIGFKTEWIDMPEEMNRSGHFFANMIGQQRKKITPHWPFGYCF